MAQVLKRDESVELKTDVKFALDLAERLDKAMRELVDAEAKKQNAELPKVGGGGNRHVGVAERIRFVDRRCDNESAKDRRPISME